ncbi:MAG: ribonuclease III domain-containing protein [Erysipelotrichaceae bacterium]
MNGAQLAFIGDAIISLYVREYLLSLGLTQSKQLQETSVKYVSAKAQSLFMMSLLDLKILSDDELLIYKRGRNHKSESQAKNTDVVTYRQATGLEALFGYWYLNQNETRLKQIWDIMKTSL